MTGPDTIANCPNEIELQAFVEGGGDRDRIRGHMDTCDACRELLVELGRRSRSIPPTTEQSEIVGGRYRITRQLGRGGMGEVFEAVRIDLGDRVALKRIRASAMGDDARKRFLQEAKSLAAVVSPFVVRIIDFGAGAEDEPWLAMEYLEGPSLSTLIERQGALSESELVPIALQLLSGLEAAHEAGVLHRDIKPSNVIVQDGGVGGAVIKLIDFGLARAVEPSSAPLTSRNYALGTPGYMSPEQLAGEPDIDGRTDVYSVGATLFDAATGIPPEPSTSSADIKRALAARAGQLSPGLRDVLARALHPDRESRFQDAKSMADALSTRSDSPEVETVRETGVARTGAPKTQRSGLAHARPPRPVDKHTLISASPDEPPRKRPRRELLAWLLTTAALGVAVSVYWASSRPPRPSVVAPVLQGVPSASVTAIALPSTDAASSANTAAASSATAAVEARTIKKPICAEGALIRDGKCIGGKWSCVSNETACGNVCTDLSNDLKNCGKCGSVCAANEYCRGSCIVCPSPWLMCNGRCTDPDLDDFNCGHCGVMCAIKGKGRCRAGVCE